MLAKCKTFASALDNKINRIRGEIGRAEQVLSQSVSKLNAHKHNFENFRRLIIECNASGIVSRHDLGEQQRMIAVLISKQENVYQKMLSCRNSIVEQQAELKVHKQLILTTEKRRVKIENFIKKIRQESLIKKQTAFENEIEEQVACGYSN